MEEVSRPRPLSSLFCAARNKGAEPATGARAPGAGRGCGATPPRGLREPPIAPPRAWDAVETLGDHYKNAEINILAHMSLCTWVSTSVGKYLGHLIAESKENKRSCLQFSHLGIKDSLKDLFSPQMEISLMMYTRNNFNCAEPLFEQSNSLNINFNVSKKTVWLIHGYRPMGSAPTWLQNFLRVLLNQDDINVIVVDWNRGATTLLYNRAVRNTRKVAVSLSSYIRNLLDHGASLHNFHFIGMSLGAHISGFVGKIFQGQLGRITGLDPAGPKFSGKSPNDRLAYTDAKFVDVIHSDANGLGIKEPVGHIDFYPNGGKTQPGCPKSILSDFKAGSCVDCDYNKGKSCPRLGYQAELWKDVLNARKETTVFLDTTGRSPFCTYYFVLTMTLLDETMEDGYIRFKLLNHLGKVKEPELYEESTSFNDLQEVKILARFLNDVVNISSMSLTYFQNTNLQCLPGGYNIQRIMLQSLTHPERPPLCKYNFVLDENVEVFLNLRTCSSKEI
ncbi:lipase member I [Lontra canadensis]|uniref:lipase member I n=1 Tax=Lontra canadensis TaxID=76717 RepID=UPI0013F360D0|nr:lipase member I [Lontra canadensis]